MSPETISFFTAPENLKEWIIIVATIFSGIAALIVICVTVTTQIVPWYRARRDQNCLEKGLSSDLYLPDVIERSTRYYIEPDCQSLDPAGSEEPRLTLATKQKLFTFMDGALNDHTQYRYIILLADTGMGKSSFLLNYYARHLRRSRRKFDIALIPLGIPDVDMRITALQNPGNTVLFLDALDEDTLAIVDHAERLRDILNLTQKFRKIIITCRTQFFPKDEEIPKETGVVKLVPREAGESGEYLFHKLYLSPFTDEQVNVYLKHRYSFWQRQRRKSAREMVDKIPNLIVRPMLLSYINDLLLNDKKDVCYSFELYEKMVDAWLIREEGVFKGIKKESLLQFSEQLAVDLYMNREQRGAERIPREEVIALASQWNIPLDDWQLTGRSLLNRDAVGNYKFAHRSIMEYLIVKRVFSGDRSYIKKDWTDQMIKFYREMAIGKSLRSSPLKNLKDSDIEKMLKRYGFFDGSKNEKGKGITHFYQLKEESGQKVVDDYATGLMWQQSGSDKNMAFEKANDYITKLNNDKFAGYSDWRLPTLEEAMSLMESSKKNGDLYIDPVFDKTKRWIWASDLHSASRAWVVYFYDGLCYNIFSYDVFVRAVR